MTNIKYRILLILLIFTTIIIGCKDDDPETQVETFLCCGDNPFASLNINNLNQTQGKIIIPDVFTPNSDGLNDTFIIPSLTSYSNHSVTIYDLNDNVIYESYENNGFIVWFNGKKQNIGEELEFGSYKYKVVIENEQTYLKYGYLCLVRKSSEANGFDFLNCVSPQTAIGIDPVLNN